MTSADHLARLNPLLRELSDVLYPAAVTDADGRAWERAYLDVRGGESGGSWLLKWRAVLAGGEVLAELDAPLGTSATLDEMFQLRDEFPNDPRLYGVLLAVYPDGRVETTFDYDPDCVSKGFFDS